MWKIFSTPTLNTLSHPILIRSPWSIFFLLLCYFNSSLLDKWVTYYIFFHVMALAKILPSRWIHMLPSKFEVIWHCIMCFFSVSCVVASQNCRWQTGCAYKGSWVGYELCNHLFCGGSGQKCFFPPLIWVIWGGFMRIGHFSDMLVKFQVNQNCVLNGFQVLFKLRKI